VWEKSWLVLSCSGKACWRSFNNDLFHSLLTADFALT